MPIETHEYNTNHYLCFSCQSTVAFLEDSRFFETHKNKISFEMITKDEVMRKVVMRKAVTAGSDDDSNK